MMARPGGKASAAACPTKLQELQGAGLFGLQNSWVVLDMPIETITIFPAAFELPRSQKTSMFRGIEIPAPAGLGSVAD